MNNLANVVKMLEVLVLMLICVKIMTFFLWWKAEINTGIGIGDGIVIGN